MKIICMIPVWRRPEILNLCISRFKATPPPYADIEPVFILSSEDPDFDLNHKLVHDFRYLVYKNKPLGEKKNAGMRFCLKFQWDYYMDLGSDNVFTSHLWDIYHPYFEKNRPFFGLVNGHFYDTLTERVLWVSDYAYDHNNNPIAWGGCRMIRRDVVRDVGTLWRDDHHSGMDGMSHWNITQRGWKCDLVDTGREPVIMNIITFVNINPIETVSFRGEEVDVAWARHAFGLDEISKDVRLLTFHGFHTEIEKLAQQMPKKEDAFNQVNIRYERAFGVVRYKNYETYKSTVSQTYGR